ncbi:patatin-like phospholipase domain-containing protein 2 [Cololabis saira]|uniref:patatin-like phospholipase domain-containing protein 2 n=1 Tax=Cololabis saira TaxID=129043 RepID=UPI002AD5184D|nr:patatin-like phospholipase domain-containing protein 2 [Cololabis saira]
MAPSISNCLHREVPWDISFSGSGFLATYQLGVALCFLKNAPWVLRSAACILGASAGSLIAAAVVCDINLISIQNEMLVFAKHLTALTLGPLNPSVSVFHWLEAVLNKYLPSDAHRRASGRLGVAVTRLTDGKQLVVSEFQSREEVLQSLLCSCFVPGYSGFLPPTFRGVRYIDGGLSGIQPARRPDSSSHTLTVCPYSGDTDICPVDPPCMFEMVVDRTILNLNMTNAFRILNSLWPMTLEVRCLVLSGDRRLASETAEGVWRWSSSYFLHCPFSLQTLEQAFFDGYNDGNAFLQSKNLAPSVVPHKVLQGPLSHDPHSSWRHFGATKDEDEETKVEKENMRMTSLSNYRAMQMICSTESKPTTDNILQFDMVKKVLLGNMTSNLSMFGLPVRIFSTLFLPLMVSFYAVLQSRQRIKLLFSHFPEVVTWTWQSVRNCSSFFFSILVGTFKKLIKDRVMHIILLLQWLHVDIPYEVL